MSIRSPGAALLTTALLFAAPGVAWAQSQQEIFPLHRPTALDVQLFEPAISPRSITTLDLATVPSHLSFTLGLWTNYAAHPLTVSIERAGGSTDRAVVSQLFQSELHASLGLFEYFEVGVAMPLTFTTHLLPTADASTLDFFAPSDRDASDVRLGDLRAFVKVPLLRGAWPLAIRAGVTFPTGGQDAFAGNVNWTFTPALVLSHAFGSLMTTATLGYRFRQRNGFENFALDDELLWGVGAQYAITRRVMINSEIFGRVGISSGAFEGNRNPVEILLGGTLQLTDAFSLQLGAGRGLSNGYGSPDYRFYLGARLTVTRTTCTSGPEDYDGYQDGDYCADPDNDGDGIVDGDDHCPNDAEDRDGYADTDGCPDPDNDADGILDDDDRCPTEPEDQDGFDDADGCPDTDNDRDGVPDARDRCPMEPEDPDNYQDDDGCPEPGPEAIVVTRTETHLLLSHRVYFDYDSDRIRDVSLPILNEVANTLRRNPDITRVRVEGYTDGVGDAPYNLDLSYRRARAVVEYLVSQQLNRDMLEYQGYGETHPVADDNTPEGQALNRRVEFTILSQAGARNTPTPATTGNGPGSSGQTPRRRRHHHSEGPGGAAP